MDEAAKPERWSSTSKLRIGRKPKAASEDDDDRLVRLEDTEVNTACVIEGVRSPRAAAS